MHVKQQIREAIAEALTGLATTGPNVYTSRVYPLDALPCLTVYTTHSELNEEEKSSSADTFDLELTIEAAAAAAAGVDDILDTIETEVVAALGDGSALPVLIKDLAFETSDTNLDDGAEIPIGVNEMTWTCKYRVARGDAETLIA